jgi:hypothetical protein
MDVRIILRGLALFAQNILKTAENDTVIDLIITVYVMSSARNPDRRRLIRNIRWQSINVRS